MENQENYYNEFEEAKPKKRGRPRKIFIEEIKEKRPQGRPRKYGDMTKKQYVSIIYSIKTPCICGKLVPRYHKKRHEDSLFHKKRCINEIKTN